MNRPGDALIPSSPSHCRRGFFCSRPGGGLAPGYAFGPNNDAHIRLCYAQSHERLEEGLRRLVRYIERHANALDHMPRQAPSHPA